jgi:hypothetical protein
MTPHHEAPTSSNEPAMTAVEATAISDGADRSILAHASDPSVPKTAAATKAGTRRAGQRGDIQWVRLSDLITGLGMSGGRASINGQERMVRYARSVPRRAIAATRRGISNRAARLAPLSSFGQTVSQPALARASLGGSP